jgi:hypothetical protein
VVPSAEDEHWNQLVGDGWVERWHPTHQYRRRDWLWVLRTENEFLLFPGSEDRPRLGSDPHYWLNGNLVYRALGHPDGPSSVPWFVIRSGSVYPGEGYPEGPGGRPRYRVEVMRRKQEGVSIRRVQAQDLHGTDPP